MILMLKYTGKILFRMSKEGTNTIYNVCGCWFVLGFPEYEKRASGKWAVSVAQRYYMVTIFKLYV